MELSQEIIDAQGFSTEQVAALNGFVTGSVIPTLKGEYDGVANTNAEGILAGASTYASKSFGVELEREQGEKFGDYLGRIADASLEVRKTTLTTKEAELATKLENFKGGDEFRTQITGLTTKNDTLLQKNAELEKLVGFDKKYEDAQKELSGLKLQVSFNQVKPSFPEGVNKYEADAKWNEFKNTILAKNTIELIDNVAYAIDIENPHKKTKLSEMVGSDESLKELLQGRQQGGNGASAADLETVEGVPFKIPKDATNEDLSKLAREHITKKLGSITHPNFSSEFVGLLTKIKAARK